MGNLCNNKKKNLTKTARNAKPREKLAAIWWACCVGALLGATKHENRGVAEEKGWYCRGWVSGVSVDFRVDSRPASVCRGDAVCLRGRRSGRRPSYFWAKIRWPATTSALHTQRPATAATSGTSGSSPPLAPTRKRLNGPLKSHHNTAGSRSENCFSGEVKKKNRAEGRLTSDFCHTCCLSLSLFQNAEAGGNS